MAAPAFAIVRGGEEAVDEGFVRGGIGVGDEGSNGFGGGRKTGEIEGDAADEGRAVGGGRRLHAVFAQLGQDENIDGVTDPGGTRLAVARRNGMAGGA